MNIQKLSPRLGICGQVELSNIPEIVQAGYRRTFRFRASSPRHGRGDANSIGAGPGLLPVRRPILDAVYRRPGPLTLFHRMARS